MAVQIASPRPSADNQVRRADSAPAFRRVVVALDQLAPDQGAFAQGLEWARRLHVPLAGLIGADAECAAQCSAACDRLQVPFASVGRSVNSAYIKGDLLAIGHCPPREHKKRILDAAIRENSSAILVCPNHGESLRRMLLLDHGEHGIESSLPIAVEICRAFGAKLVVLTVARTMAEANRRQQAAVGVFAAQDLEVDFDVVVGSNVVAAVAGVARWRRCQLVLQQRQRNGNWWRRPGDPSPRRLLDDNPSLAVLSMPGRFVYGGRKRYDSSTL